MANNNFIQKALGLFNLKRADNRFSGRIEPDNPMLHTAPKGFHLPNYSPLSQIWDWYLQGCLNSNEDLKNRQNRYEDLDFASKNSPLIKMAVDLFADEAVQCDIGSCPVRVKAKKEVQEYINDLFDKWGITQQRVRETIWNKVLFGDAFELNDIRGKEGIVQVVPVSVWDVADRLEFDPSKVMEAMKQMNTSTANNSLKLQSLMSDLEYENEGATAFFNKYLLGFELLGGRMTAPWGVTHYRSYTMLREFAPWGRSRFINVLPQFRQLTSAEGLMQVARAASFPRDVYAVKSDPGASKTERWANLEEFQEQLDNTSMTQGSKELPSIGSRIIIPDEIVNYQSFKSDIDVDAISDVEYLRDNLIMGLMIPKGYLIANDGGWGNSGQSLLQQFKPFGRLVFSDQSDYLQGLSEKIKMHLAIINKFDGWDTPFELEMEFPVIEESSDRVARRAEELTLANNVVDTLKNILGVDKVPPEIVKSAFGTFTSMQQATIDDYVDKLIKFNKENDDFNNNDDQQDDELGFGGGVESKVDPIGDMNKISTAFKGEKRKRRGLSVKEQYERARNRWQENDVKDCAAEAIIGLKAKSRLYEGAGNGKHFLSSLQNTNDMKKDKKILEAFCEDAQGKSSVDLRESLTEARSNKEDWEEWNVE